RRPAESSRTCGRCLRHRPEVRARPPLPPVPAAARRDREAAHRSSPGRDAEAGGGPAPGRPRTKFSSAQLQELERSFREQRYIGASEKQRLAAALNLSQSQVSAAGAAAAPPGGRAPHRPGPHSPAGCGRGAVPPPGWPGHGRRGTGTDSNLRANASLKTVCPLGGTAGFLSNRSALTQPLNPTALSAGPDLVSE
uniref:Homeobox domain-containing protein n=1 Tax=Falco tinnunculus TaxID=100819 RepID=A0A8C4UB98_FALTI